MSRLQMVLAASVVAVAGGCASLGALGNLVQAPRFSEADGRSAEIRLLPPSTQRPLGGAAVRLWANVENPNAFALRLAQLTGNLYLDGVRAADVDFPLGVPLVAQGDTIVPLDISFSFSDIAALGDVISGAVGTNRVNYRFDGTIGVDAGALGQPTFGPNTLLRGNMRIFR